MDLKISLTYLLTQLAITYKNNLQKSMNVLGLHNGQLFILISLWETDGQRQIDVAKNLNLTPPTINKMVGSLQRNGFIQCRKCENDGRSVRLYLTEKGLQSKTLVEEKWIELESFSFANLTDTEKLMMLQLLKKVKDNLDENSRTFRQGFLDNAVDFQFGKK